jgi:lipid-A-disaccharide synthase
MSKTIMIIAGEASGDWHGASLVDALKRQDEDILFFGVGGNRMRDAGVDLSYHADELAYIGFSEVARHYFFFRRVFYDLLSQVRERQPDIVVLIDYPGFNLRFAHKVKQMGVRVFYYIAPQVWAWGRKRARKMARDIDHLAVLFPFEETFFTEHGLATTFVGHPLLDELEVSPTRENFFQNQQWDPERPLLALLPGSRRQEVAHLLPPLLETAQRLQVRHPELQIGLGLAESIPESTVTTMLQSYPGVRVVRHQTRALLKYARAAIVASGTATLEAACMETPFLLVYRVSPVTYFLGKRLVKIPHIGLANVVAKKAVVDEILQNDVRPEILMPRMERLLFDDGVRRQVIDDLRQVRAHLGEPGAPDRVATLIRHEMERKKNS